MVKGELWTKLSYTFETSDILHRTFNAGSNANVTACATKLC